MGSKTNPTQTDAASIHNLRLIVKDYIRTIKLPAVKSKKPIAIILTGIPASGKSYLAQNLAINLPLVLLSENSIQSFLVPKISFFERGQEVINEFARETIENLTKDGFSSIFDANLRTSTIREEFRQAVGKAGGELVVIHLNCPANAAFDRIKRRNAEIVSGVSKGFVLDWDYFQYEINSTELPIRREMALTFDSSQPDHQMEKLTDYLKRKINQIQ